MDIKNIKDIKEGRISRKEGRMLRILRKEAYQERKKGY